MIMASSNTSAETYALPKKAYRFINVKLSPGARIIQVKSENNPQNTRIIIENVVSHSSINSNEVQFIQDNDVSDFSEQTQQSMSHKGSSPSQDPRLVNQCNANYHCSFYQYPLNNISMNPLNNSVNNIGNININNNIFPNPH